MIPMLDLVAQYRAIQSEIEAAMLGVLESGHFILGPNVSAFEQEMAAYLGVKHAVGLASGTDALIIALRAAGIGAGDEVIVPAYSFFATAGCVMTVGATPVFVDIEPHTYSLDADQMESRLTPRTRAILPVHLYGQPVDMNGVLSLARDRGLLVIEDNAQAIGAEFQGRKTGGLGDIGCLSFYPTKNLGAYGDAGMLVTNDDRLAESARMLHTHGWKKKYFPEMLGYNSRLDEIQAAVLRVKLKYLDDWNAGRRELAHEYSRLLADGPVRVPYERPGATHVYHLYIIRSGQREVLRERLKAAGIASDVYYPQPMHLAVPCRALGCKPGDFPAAEQASRETLALPLYPEMTFEQAAEVARIVQG